MAYDNTLNHLAPNPDSLRSYLIPLLKSIADLQPLRQTKKKRATPR
ncbi:hypothetical protein HYR99_31155 [Candidatus Poribacteria bacterium]|nr:hypothetical protein [Candidatus Poribacteria bacterium]